ncbi:hypothetical protein AX14_011076 [Amanita brunnescens Koide BX004]|nr:hypothetical protein AX14_011076 [Amanita brunnescens Koide BX004]
MGVLDVVPVNVIMIRLSSRVIASTQEIAIPVSSLGENDSILIYRFASPCLRVWPKLLGVDLGSDINVKAIILRVSLKVEVFTSPQGVCQRQAAGAHASQLSCTATTASGSLNV